LHYPLESFIIHKMSLSETQFASLALGYKDITAARIALRNSGAQPVDRLLAQKDRPITPLDLDYSLVHGIAQAHFAGTLEGISLGLSTLAKGRPIPEQLYNPKSILKLLSDSGLANAPVPEQRESIAMSASYLSQALLSGEQSLDLDVIVQDIYRHTRAFNFQAEVPLNRHGCATAARSILHGHLSLDGEVELCNSSVAQFVNEAKSMALTAGVRPE
jgi:hypothetical protein